MIQTLARPHAQMTWNKLNAEAMVKIRQWYITLKFNTQSWVLSPIQNAVLNNKNMSSRPIHRATSIWFAGGGSVPVWLGNRVFASSTPISWVTEGAGGVTFCRCCGFFTIKQPPRRGLAWEVTLPLSKCLPLRILPLLTLASTRVSNTPRRWTSIPLKTPTAPDLRKHSVTCSH